MDNFEKSEEMLGLGAKYLAYKEEEAAAKKNAERILEEVTSKSSHKVGEIIKWVERKRKKVGPAHDSYYDKVGEEVEKKAVLTKLEPYIYRNVKGIVRVSFIYTFVPITLKGNLGNITVRPQIEFEWTGEQYVNLNKKNYNILFRQWKKEHPHFKKEQVTDSYAFDFMDWYDEKHGTRPNEEDGPSDEAHEFAMYVWREILGLEW